jgi:hypothetical protein
VRAVCAPYQSRSYQRFNPHPSSSNPPPKLFPPVQTNDKKTPKYASKEAESRPLKHHVRYAIPDMTIRWLGKKSEIRTNAVANSMQAKTKKHSGKYKHGTKKQMRMREYVRTLQTQSVVRCGPLECVFLNLINDEARVHHLQITHVD